MTGLPADVKTISAFGCYPLTVLTAINTGDFASLHGWTNIDASVVIEQLEDAVRPGTPDAVKIGFLSDAQTVEAVAERLSRFPNVPIVVDPVLARFGDTELQPKYSEALILVRDLLLPRATVLVPNVPSAEFLTGVSIVDGDNMERAAQVLLDMGPGAILLKGGKSRRAHSDDLLAYREEGGPVTFTWFHSGRVREYTRFGAGSTLSSAIAAGLARGKSVRDACEDAKIFLTAALRAGSQVGVGDVYGLVHHYYAWWNM